MECLQPVSLHPGDVLRISPGTVHALCKGVVLLEIHEPSDTTFRLYDYGQLGLDGQPRELHVEQALRFMSFDAASAVVPETQTLPWGQREHLVTTPAYTVERLELHRDLLWTRDSEAPQVMVLLSGQLELASVDEPALLNPGDTVPLPAALQELEVRVASDACVLMAAPVA